MGENLFTFDQGKNPREWHFPEDGKYTLGNIMAEPRFALSGTLGISHETDIKDALTFRILKDGEPLKFHVVRNVWTPAYMDTYYRCEPVGAYKRSGLIVVRERKCITASDVFCSYVEIINDDNDEASLRVEILVPFEKEKDGVWRVNAVTKPRAMKRIYSLNGAFVALCSRGDAFDVTLQEREKTSFKIAASYAPKELKKTIDECDKILKKNDIIEQNEVSFNTWFEKNVPDFRCDNLKLLKTYYYRFYLIKKNTFTPKKLIPEHEYRGTAFYESATGSWYGCPVGLPVPMQVLEGNWLKNKEYSKSQLDNWLRINSLKGYIQFTPMAAWEYYLQTKDKNWLKKAYSGFENYTRLSVFEDPEKLPKTRGSWPTGAEYQPSFYQHTEVPWDYRYDNRRCNEVGGEIKYLWRLDEISYLIANLSALELMARELAMVDQAKAYKKLKSRRIKAVSDKFWSEKRSGFVDMECDTGKLCDEAIC